ncbi:response regulator transcription factor [Uliginosibacterium sediminicola]|uniref:Response regulator transcription factor n=1 Tax=Uliginosibacterium sediminicola TaxID=2024550 RepID=A0ABU9YUT1_9RHOO
MNSSEMPATRPAAQPELMHAAPGEAKAKIRVLIADDHVTVREGLVAMIGRQPDMEVVAEAADGRAAVSAWLAHQPDVCLLDLRMPILDGVATIGEIRQLAPAARIIVLTTFDTDSDIANAIKAGARGYLLKDSQREELLDCIRRVNGGETCIPPALVAKLAAGISNEALTGRELDVLSLLARGKSNKEIGANLYISETTVKSHLRSIFTKLNVLSRTEAITVASRRGLVKI